MHMGNFEEAETLLLEALNKVSDEPTLSFLKSVSTQPILNIMSSEMLTRFKSMRILENSLHQI